MMIRCKKDVTNDAERILDPTSSLNDHFMCICGKKFILKGNLVRHLKNCGGKEIKKPIVCSWCNAVFKNLGNLVWHLHKMHAVNRIKDKTTGLLHKCDVCDVTYKHRYKLTFHIRRAHFNLLARIPHADRKQVNQTWLEKVQNSDTIVEMQKTGENKLVIKPATPTSGDKVHELNRTVDLRSLYPTGRDSKQFQCNICLKYYKKYDLKKHINEKHKNITKHKCNNCNRTFKRLYIYLKHICYNHKTPKGKCLKKPKLNGVTQSKKSSIHIANVRSLQPIVL